MKELFQKIKDKGFFYCVQKWLGKFLYGITCQVLGLMAYPLCRALNIKFIRLSERAIGHLCVELDCYIKEGILGLRPPYRTILLAPAKKVANAHLLSYWKKYITIITRPWLCVLLDPLEKNRWTCYPTYQFAHSPKKGPFYPKIQKEYFGRPPLLVLTESDRKRGEKILQEMGVPQGSYYVCVHCREDGFWGNIFGNIRQSVRNADIQTYFLSMEEIVKRGGWVIRMGDPTMKPLPSMKHVIDYAHSDFKSDSMDVFLCASCKFFLGSCSGLYNAADVFGVPAAVANCPHMAGVLPYAAQDIAIPKLVWSDKEQRYLRFREIWGTSISDFLFDTQFAEANLTLVDNTPEDIKDLAVEMFDRIDGKKTYDDRDGRLQEQFKALMSPKDFSYGAHSRVGRDFLRKYAHLL